MHRTWQVAAMLACGPVVVLAGSLSAQTTSAPASSEEKPAAKAAAAPAGGLATQQQQVAERFRELEKLLLRMAELTAPTDPRRAALLRQAVAQSKERDLDHQFEQLVELLRQERLSLVVKNQSEVQQDLVKLLELLLSEDRTKRIESEKARIREYLKRVNKIIKEQKGIQGETAREGDARKLADRQGDLSDKTAELAGDIRENEGRKLADRGAKEGQQGDGDKGDKKDESEKRPDGSDPKKPDRPHDKDSDQADKPKKDDGQPDEGDKKPGGDQGEKGKRGDKKNGGQPSREQKPGQPNENPDGEEGQGSGEPGEPPPPENSPAQKRLQQAQQRMKEAQQKLEEAKRGEATEKQAEALKELEQAKADLEEILRQLREEETSRTLAMLEGRFRKMLDQQVEVYEGTKRLAKVPQAQRDRDDEIEAGRMSRKESQIAGEADKALAVLREEGTAVAFPEAVTEMRDDMQQVVDRLGQAKVGEVTQGIEKDIIAALEEMIASLQKAQKDKDSKSAAGQPAPDGDSDPPLVDTLSELKMIRALQMRVNLRTQRYAEMTKTEQTDKPDLLEALKRLAEREQRIHQVTRDIAVGRNQ
ncbi:MAG: hypothetical protein HY288_18325 [Planctomycetia bacterium]|nr:hypothetical protein [Planctomycetia bacterium]